MLLLLLEEEEESSEYNTQTKIMEASERETENQAKEALGFGPFSQPSHSSLTRQGLARFERVEQVVLTGTA